MSDYQDNVPQAVVNLSADIKADRAESQREALRQAFADAFGRKPWAVSLAYGDFGKVLCDLRKGRVTETELWNATDGGRRSGTLSPRIVQRFYSILAGLHKPTTLPV